LIPNISEALTELKALGDKAYYGSDLIYVPYKKFKGKRFTRDKKEFNKLLSSNRVIVENVNKRLEDFKVLGTIYRGKRDDEEISKVVRVVASLHNFLLDSHPMRSQRKRT
jgi:thiamine kinase-like enzyme